MKYESLYYDYDSLIIIVHYQEEDIRHLILESNITFQT